MTIKLYKMIDGKFHYWETWNDDLTSSSIHWGVVGDNGKSKEVKEDTSANCLKIVQKEMQEQINAGYEEIATEDQYVLIIEYKVDGFGTDEDLVKRYALEDKMNELLGWAGLGCCDGGSIGNDTMEVCCYVVDFDLAKKLIKENLKGTEFADYTRIYDEDE